MVYGTACGISLVGACFFDVRACVTAVSVIVRALIRLVLFRSAGRLITVVGTRILDIRACVARIAVAVFHDKRFILFRSAGISQIQVRTRFADAFVRRSIAFLVCSRAIRILDAAAVRFLTGVVGNRVTDGICTADGNAGVRGSVAFFRCAAMAVIGAFAAVISVPMRFVRRAGTNARAAFFSARTGDIRAQVVVNACSRSVVMHSRRTDAAAVIARFPARAGNVRARVVDFAGSTVIGHMISRYAPLTIRRTVRHESAIQAIFGTFFTGFAVQIQIISRISGVQMPAFGQTFRYGGLCDVQIGF